jgi:C4-dicarboxylate transporter DctQ subunit
MLSSTHLLKWIDRATGLMALIAGLLLCFMMVSICYDVVVRAFGLQPPVWVTEITEYILLYVTFLGAAWVLKEDGHVRVDVALNQFSERTREGINIGTSVLGVLVCLVLTWFGAETTWDFFNRSIPVIKSLSVPKFLLLGIIPVGSFFLCIQFLHKTLGLWKDYTKSSDVKRARPDDMRAEM